MNTTTISKEYPNFDLIKCKQQLNLIDDDNSEDNFLQTKYIQAVAITEGYLGKDVGLTVKQFVKQNFNSDTLTIEDYNYIEVVSISGDSTLITGYTITVSNLNNINIEFENNVNVDELVINYKTGFDQDKIPSAIEASIMIKLTDLYSNRGSYTLGSYKDTGAFEMSLNAHKALR